MNIIEYTDCIYIFLLAYWNMLFNFSLNIVTVGWASWQNVQGFGEPPTVKSQILNLIRSIRTVARGNYRKKLFKFMFVLFVRSS